MKFCFELVWWFLCKDSEREPDSKIGLGWVGLDNVDVYSFKLMEEM